MISMRLVACLGLLMGIAACWAQSGTEGAQPEAQPGQAQKDLPSSSEINSLIPKPQVIINVREHQFSPDLVTVTFLDASYPQDLLKAQLVKLGSYTGSPPRGLKVFTETIQAKVSTSFLKATFATDNIIDRSSSQLHLERVIKPFLGAPEPHQINSFLVTFEGEVPNSRTLRVFSSDFVIVAGSASLIPKGVEYKIYAKTQDPDKLTIPTEGHQPGSAPPRADSQLSPAIPLPALLMLIAGSLILGALVYFLSVRLSGGKKP